MTQSKIALILVLFAIALTTFFVPEISTYFVAPYSYSNESDIFWPYMERGTRTMFVRSEIIPITRVDAHIRRDVNIENKVVFKYLDIRPPVDIIYQDKIYSYLEIDQGKLTTQDILYANITFEVSKYWLEENRLSKENISLYRYTDPLLSLEDLEQFKDQIGWYPLPTEIVDESARHVTFRSMSPGFGYLLIAESPIGDYILLDTPEDNSDSEDEKTKSSNITEKFSPIESRPLKPVRQDFDNPIMEYKPQIMTTSYLLLFLSVGYLITILIIKEKARRKRAREEF